MSSSRDRCAHRSVIGAGAVACALAMTANAYAWNEVGDAGDGLGGNWQVIDDSQGNTLTEITGVTDDAASDFLDAYLFSIEDSMEFSASTQNGSTFDTVLYLFEMNGAGLLANDDISAVSTRSRLVASSNDGTGINVGPGIYFLVVTGFQIDAVDSADQLLFDIPIGDNTQISGPDGGGMNQLDDWVDNSVLGVAATGSYTVTLTGAGIIPTPGSVALFGAAGLLGFGRRRR